jgi:hypothetical protein
MVIAALAGCSTERIAEGRLVKILAQMHYIDALITEHNGAIPMTRNDSAAIYAPIFAKYNASMQQLYPSMQQYMSNKDKMAALYDKVIKILETQDKKYAMPLDTLKEQTSQTN